jgi:recombination associated protein RdgC
LLGPLIDSLIDALGGEMELGAAAADPVPSTTRTVLNSTVSADAAATDGDPPF